MTLKDNVRTTHFFTFPCQRHLFLLVVCVLFGSPRCCIRSTSLALQGAAIVAPVCTEHIFVCHQATLKLICLHLVSDIHVPSFFTFTNFFSGWQDAGPGDKKPRNEGEWIRARHALCMRACVLACVVRLSACDKTEVCVVVISHFLPLSLPFIGGQTFFAEAATNPAVYMRIPSGAAGSTMSPADAPFVDAAADDGLEL